MKEQKTKLLEFSIVLKKESLNPYLPTWNERRKYFSPLNQNETVKPLRIGILEQINKIAAIKIKEHKEKERVISENRTKHSSPRR